MVVCVGMGVDVDVLLGCCDLPFQGALSGSGLGDGDGDACGAEDRGELQKNLAVSSFQFRSNGTATALPWNLFDRAAIKTRNSLCFFLFITFSLCPTCFKSLSARITSLNHRQRSWLPRVCTKQTQSTML